MILNHLSQCHLVIQLCLCAFEILAPTLKFFEMTKIHTNANVLFSLLSLFHRSPLFCFQLSSAVMPVFFQFSPFFSSAALRIRYFHCLKQRINLSTKLQRLTEFFLLLQHDLHDTYKELLPIEFSWTHQLRQHKRMFLLSPIPR